jgi:hypothetical protein
MNQFEQKYALGLDRIPYRAVTALTAEAADAIIISYQLYDLDDVLIKSPVNLRFVLSSATGDTGAIIAQAAADVSAIAISNTRGLLLDKLDTDTELVSVGVRTVAPGAATATPANTDSNLSISITMVNVAGATLYAKLYNQYGILVNETTMVWV